MSNSIAINTIPSCITTAVEDSKIISYFDLSPNPATTSVTISIDEDMVGGIATISDITGRQLMKWAVQIRNSQFDIRDYSSGVYFVTVTTTDGRSATHKLVVSK